MDEPGKQTVFYLCPRNQDAKDIVNHPSNRSHRYQPLGHLDQWRLRIGLDPLAKYGRLVSFGRLSDVNDVILQEPGEPQESRYSKTQYYFAFHTTTGELLLHDMSTLQNKSLIDGTSEKYWNRIPRQGVVRLDKMGMRLVLAGAVFDIEPTIRDRNRFREQGLDFARDSRPPPEFAATIAPSDTGHKTRVHCPSPREPDVDLIHEEVRHLGRGSFGDVREVVDMHTGAHFAVKFIAKDAYKQSRLTEMKWRESVRNEVLVHQELSHDHIVECIMSQGWKLGRDIEIFMPVYGPNAWDLFRAESDPSIRHSLAKTLAEQMLSALDYLHNYGDKPIIHRDVKPHNILFRDRNFYLGDFGLAKAVHESETLAGTMWYMAPEVYLKKLQTTKVDMYGLGATLAECLGQLPATEDRPHGLAWHNVLRKSVDGSLLDLLDRNPDRRRTARQCLDQDLPSSFKVPSEIPTSELSSMEWIPSVQPETEDVERPTVDERVRSSRTSPTEADAKYKQPPLNVHPTKQLLEATKQSAQPRQLRHRKQQ